MSAFEPVPAQASFPEQELAVLQQWEAGGIFARSVQERPEKDRYVFYDGPPFATGLPHYGHLVASTLKDVVPRYWTMQGYRVERRFGWDTHGLPIEMLMEKKLGLSGPTSVREYGVAAFNEACRANVLTYTEEWRKVISRLGRWVDFDDDYKTMDAPFMESVWWVFKQLWDRDLVYRAFRVMPYSWRLSTSLSNFEANLDYRDVQDPAITVTLPVKGQPGTHLLVWTTTPWTLPSNLAVAVGSDITYVKAQRSGDDAVYIVAKERLKPVLGKKAKVIQEIAGSELVGLEYEPLFDYFADRIQLPKGEGRPFVVIASGHVTTSDGTGLVHMAPDFGEDDYAACRAVNIDILQSVDAEGNFTDAITGYAGRNVKEADTDIIRELKGRGRLINHDTIQHSYPYCWRSGTPLIYRAQPARFVKVTALRDRMVALNRDIRWVPEAVGQGRFGNWLADARDWNVSRNRFWGTPLPIWTCEACQREECLGAIAELEEKSGASVDDLHPHKIDHLGWACSDCGGAMKRVPDVFDCWFESGAMPYAQGHYPFEGKDVFERDFPAQFIAEGLDQTRGWFYTLLVLSTALFDGPPFKNVVVNGMVLAEDGRKMSKSEKNYPPPDRIFEEYGADALRAYLINSPIVRAEPLKFSEAGVREVVRSVLIPLQNAWSFFNQYANIDGWSPQTGLPSVGTPAIDSRSELDRWLLSTLQTLVRDVTTHMEAYRLYLVVPEVLGFIGDLTNWYIRLSRRRFWRSVDDEAGRADKAAAYATLYTALVTFSKVLAPFLPFLSESIYQNLVVGPGVHAQGEESVHLCRFPQVDASLIDTTLEAQVATTRRVVRLGRKLRERHRLKTRQPLATVTVVHHDPDVRQAVSSHADRIAEELNVKRVIATEDGSQLASVTYKANFQRLGRRFGKQMREAATAISALGADDWATLEAGGEIQVAGQPITAEDVLVERESLGEVVIETWKGLLVAIDTELTDELVAEGSARELISKVQRLRKETGLAITDRILVRVATDDASLRAALESQSGYCAGEILAERFDIVAGAAGQHVLDVNGVTATVDIQRV